MPDFDVQLFNRELISEFRDRGGVGTRGPVDFEHLVLLTTTGRHSRQPRTVPLGYVAEEDGSLLLFASNMGAPRDPDWLRNLERDPAVEVEITGADWRATAEILHGSERDAAYRRWTAQHPSTADHEQRAGRVIPMVRVPRR